MCLAEVAEFGLRTHGRSARQMWRLLVPLPAIGTMWRIVVSAAEVDVEEPAVSSLSADTA